MPSNNNPSDESPSPKKLWTTWEEYFQLRDADKGSVPADFMADRPLNEPFPDRPLFDDDEP